MNWKDLIREKIKNAEDRSQSKDGGAWFGFVQRTIDDERVFAAFHGGSRIHWRHPHHGMNSWIRAAPEEGTGMVLVHGTDTNTPYMVGSHLPQAVSKRLTGYSQGTNTYRPLQPGEIDIQSSGQAGAFFSADGELRLHGGVISGHLSQPEAEVAFKAPVVRLRGPEAQSDSSQDEIRFGAVKRPGILYPGLSKFVKIGSHFAKEYTRNLRTKADNGRTLVDIREGDVIKDNGELDRNSETGFPNRLNAQYFNNVGVPTKVEIDENGSTVFTLAPSAQVFSLNLGTVDFNMKFGGNRIESVSGTHSVITGKHAVMSAGGNVQIAGGRETTIAGKRKVHVTAGNTGVVNLAQYLVDKFVLGTESATILNLLGNITINVNTKGVGSITAVGSKIVFDGVPWDHAHLTGTGISGGPIPSTTAVHPDTVAAMVVAEAANVAAAVPGGTAPASIDNPLDLF